MDTEHPDGEVQESIDKLRTIGQVRLHESGNMFVELNRDTVTDEVLQLYSGDFETLPPFSLDLCRSAVTDEGLQFLSAAAGLQRITFTGRSQVTGAGFRYLADLPNLNSLDLDASGVTDEGMAGIGQVQSLRTLWLRLNYTRDAGVRHLRNLHQLERLALEKALITDDGLESIGQLTAMRQLHVNGTKISDQGLAYLSQLSQLEWLDLSRTQVSGTGLARLPRLESLQELNLSKTLMSNDSIEHMAHFPNLQRLDVSDTHVTAQGIQQLRSMLPQCEVTPQLPTGTRAVDRAFGPLVWAGQQPEWEGTIDLETLANYYCRWVFDSDSFCQCDENDTGSPPHSPQVAVTIKDPKATGPSTAQRRARLLLQEHEARICDDLLRGIHAHVRNDHDAFGSEFGGSAEEAELRAQVFTNLDEPHGMREMLSLNRIIVQRREKDNFTYLTFDFECSWDEEHGMCVVMHKNRVVEIGQMGDLSIYDFDYSRFFPDEGPRLEQPE